MAFALATYNVKNLFDPRSDPERTVLEKKLEGIAETVRACDADAVGLQEIGSAEVIRALAAKLAADGYGEPVVGTPDPRGIRVALFSRCALAFGRVATAESLSFPVFRDGDPAPFVARIPLRRGIVHAGVAAPGLGLVHVFVAHFKSPLGVSLRDGQGAEIVATTPHARAQAFVRSLVWRAAEALHLRGLTDDVLSGQPDARVAVIGDLNDLPESAVLEALRGQGEGGLVDCTRSIERSVRFSTLHRGRPAQVDHILATASLGERVVSARFLNRELRDHGPTLPGQEEPMTVDSDHAALVVRFS